MKSNLGVQPVNGERIRIGYILSTFLDMIGGSPMHTEQSEVDEEVKKVEKSQNEEYIKKLKEMVTSYKKAKPSKKIVQEYKDGKLKPEKGSKMKKAEFKIQDASKTKGMQKTQKETGEREGR